MQVFEVGIGKTYSTITAAVNAMEALYPKSTNHLDSVTINIYNGTYYENIDLTNTFGTLSYPVMIQAPAGEDVMIDGGVGTTLYYTQITSPVTAGDAVINVADTSEFPSSGSIIVNIYTITYTGKTSTSFTGCTGAQTFDTTLSNFYVTNVHPSYAIQFTGSKYVTFKNIGMTNFFRDGIDGYGAAPGTGVISCTIDGCTSYNTSPYARTWMMNGPGNIIKNGYADIGSICTFIYQVGGDTSAITIKNTTIINHATSFHAGVSGNCVSELGPLSYVKGCTFVNYSLWCEGAACSVVSNYFNKGSVTSDYNNCFIGNNIFVNNIGVVSSWVVANGASIYLRATGTGTKIYNNTINDPYGTYAIRINTSGNTLKNNIVVTTGVSKFAVYNNLATTSTMDYNCYYGSTTPSIRYGGVDYATFAAFQTASAQEANGIYANPLFSGTGVQYYDSQLSVGSPCIDTGVDLSTDGIDEDFGGFTRVIPFEMGAMSQILAITDFFVVRRNNYNIIKWMITPGSARSYSYILSRTSKTNGYDYVDIANITTLDSAGNFDTAYVDIDIENNQLYFYKVRATTSIPYDTGVYSNEETGIYFADIQDNHPELAETCAARWDLSLWDNGIFD